MNKVGSFFDLITKYNPEHANKQPGLGGGMGGFPGMGGMGGMFGGGMNPNDKGDNAECTLI